MSRGRSTATSAQRHPVHKSQVLPLYIVVMLSHGNPQPLVAENLDAFLNVNAIGFAAWCVIASSAPAVPGKRSSLPIVLKSDVCCRCHSQRLPGVAALQAFELFGLWHARLFEHVAANEDLYKAVEAREEAAQPAAASSGEADMTDAEALMEAGCVTPRGRSHFRTRRHDSACNVCERASESRPAGRRASAAIMRRTEQISEAG